MDNAIYMDKLKVKVLQGNRTNRVFTYYKGLAHMIMELDRSPNLKSASWRLRKVDGIIRDQKAACSEPRESSSSLKAGKNLMSQSGIRSFLFFAEGWPFC